MALIYAVLAGALLWAGFAPIQFWVFPIIGLAILYRNLENRTLAIRFILSFSTGLAFFLPLLHWSGIYVGAFPWIALSVLESLLFSLIALAPRGAINFAAVFTLVELIRMKAPFGGFGWGRVGFTQLDITRDAYPIFGVTGISLLIALLASSFASKKLKSALVAIFLLLAPSALPNQTHNNEISIVAIQGGVDKLGLDFNDRAMSVFNRHLETSEQNNFSADLVIWPENSVDIDPEQNELVRNEILRYLEETKKPLLVGAVQQTTSGPINTSLLYDQNGTIVSRYQKQDLAPFGEYLPIRSIAEAVSPQARRIRDFQPGKSWQVHNLNGFKFITPICFEVLDDDLIKGGVTGVDFLIAQTNNATFGTSSQAAQQLQITRARAAELHRDIAVVSTTGFTAKVAATGEIDEALPQFESGSLKMVLKTYSGDSIATRINTGLWVVFLALSMVVARIRKNR